jgi:uncharacterized protein (TIGR02246 family)
MRKLTYTTSVLAFVIAATPLTAAPDWLSTLHVGGTMLDSLDSIGTGSRAVLRGSVVVQVSTPSRRIRLCEAGSVYTTLTVPGSNVLLTAADAELTGTDSSAEGPADKERVYQALREVTARVDAAWNAGDGVAFAAQWTECGTIVNPFGQLTEGRVNIERDMTEQFAGPSQGTTHLLEITRVYVVSPFVAVADGISCVTADNSTEPWTAPFTAVFSRNKRGNWQIAHLRPAFYLQP